MKKKAAPERIAFLAQLAQAAPTPELGRLYGSAMASVARKSVVRLHSDTKARFCKKCFVPRSLQSTTWRIEDESKRKDRPVLVITCMCGKKQHRPLFPRPAQVKRRSPGERSAAGQRAEPAQPTTD